MSYDIALYTPKLPWDILVRAKLVYRLVVSPTYGTFEKFVDDLSKELSVEKELNIWERMAAVLLEYRHEYPNTTVENAALAKALLLISMGGIDENTTDDMEGLSSKDLRWLCERYYYFYRYLSPKAIK